MRRIQSRYLFEPDVNAGKMIFLSGPRQVGKTTFVRARLEELGSEQLYFNWDDPYVRREYQRNPHFLKSYISGASSAPPLVAFDEIHKHRNWKNILKGLYDIHAGEAQFIITGSARLDYFRHSGDSLVGRYFSYRLLPLGLAEAAEDHDFVIDDDTILARPDENGLLSRLQRVPEHPFRAAFDRLMAFGGFPEPFLKARDAFSRKWRRDYLSLLIHEDVRDLTRLQDIKGLEQLVLLLPERISSPMSINSLREDLQVSHKTVAGWLEALKKVYLIFSLTPWSARIARAITKEAKYYFMDWTMVGDEGARFENAVAVALCRLVCRWNELGLGDYELHYIRDRQGREVDFVLVGNGRPLALFEAKRSNLSLSRQGSHFSAIMGIPYYQIVLSHDNAEEHRGNRFLIPAWRMFALTG